MAKLIDLKKEVYPVRDGLRSYLSDSNRVDRLSVDYDDLLRFSSSVALYDSHDEDTLWTTVGYDQSERNDIHTGLIEIYATLRSEGDTSILEHLRVDRIDLCMYGNTKPFRIRIINTLNDNFDYFYVKRADASRVYGLELEHILSPNRIGFLVYAETIVEEHIYGIPGDMFVAKYMDAHLNEVRLAKEFVKFNERCFLRLLGDQHSANFVVDITVDFEENMYRIRSIDFDQQSYEPRKVVYLPQYFKENNAIVNLGIKHLTWESVRQYQREERSLIHRRMISQKSRLDRLLTIMSKDHIAPTKNVKMLGKELSEHYESKNFERCTSMGELVRESLQTIESKIGT
jgi:hypothetical protein